MRIAIDGSHWAIPGGIRSYLENLLPALAEANGGNDLRVLMRGGTAAAADTLPDGVTPVAVPWPRRVLDRLENTLGWPRVERWTGGVDAVLGIHFSLPCARRAVPKVLIVHDVAYLRRPDLYDDPAGNDYGYGYLLRHSLRRADRVIAISHATRRDLLEVTDVDPAKVWVVSSGVDPRFGAVDATECAAVRRQVGIEGSFLIYPIGTITPRKNIERTIRAFAHAFPEPAGRPALLLTGPGELPASVTRLVEELDLSASVRARRVSYPDDLRALYTAATFGVYPSLYEGFGLPPLEAMACGLPMLVADATSCPEVVGDAAQLCDPESVDAIATGMSTLWEDAALRDALCEKGLARVADPAFGWDRCARQVLAVLADDREAHAAEIDPLAIDRAVVPPAPEKTPLFTSERS